MMDNKICVYAIAKNEEKNVERWYNSMKEADKVIVLDTGSTDNTAVLLEFLGAEVHQKHYDVFRFDDARNDALALVPLEYNILVSTDIDECFEPGWTKPLREQWIEGKHEHAQYAYTWDHLADGSNGHTFVYNKIHSRNWHWRDPIHETLCRTDGTREYQTDEMLDLYNEVHLHHYQDLSVDRNWYVELAEQRLEHNPQDSLAYLELIREYCAKKHFQKCVDFGIKILQEQKDLFDNIELASIYHQMGISSKFLKQASQAIIYFISGMNICQQYRDNYMELASLYIQCGLYEMAIGVTKQALKTTYELKHWTENGLSFSWLPYDILASAYFNLQQYKLAYQYLQKALSFEPTNEDLLDKQKLFLSALTKYGK